MKKLFYLLLVALGTTMFTACSDDDDKDNSPIKGVDIPKFENPVTPGQTVTIKGEGFDEDSEIWFRAIATRTADNGDVEAEVTGVDANGITFITPSVYGNQTVLLKQEGREYKLGEMAFIDEPEMQILPKKIIKVTEYEVEDGEKFDEDYNEYNYDENGRITYCKGKYGETDRYDYAYSENEITIRYDDGYSKEKLIFTLENGRITKYSREEEENDELYKGDIVLKYAGNYLSEAVMTSSDKDSETETFSFVGGNLMKYTYVDNNDKQNHSSLEFTYGERPNNLNIDLLFYTVGEGIMGDVFQFDKTGKRSSYLPSSIKVTEPKWNENEDKIIGTETWTLEFKYEVNAEGYITKMTLEEPNGAASIYEFEYED